MINLSQATVVLARPLAAVLGVPTEDAIKQAIERGAREVAVIAEPARRRYASAEATAVRKARMDRIVGEIATMPVLDRCLL
jgi:hypothetical protein